MIIGIDKLNSNYKVTNKFPKNRTWLLFVLNGTNKVRTQGSRESVTSLSLLSCNNQGPLVSWSCLLNHWFHRRNLSSTGLKLKTKKVNENCNRFCDWTEIRSGYSTSTGVMEEVSTTHVHFHVSSIIYDIFVIVWEMRRWGQRVVELGFFSVSFSIRLSIGL